MSANLKHIALFLLRSLIIVGIYDRVVLFAHKYESIVRTSAYSIRVMTRLPSFLLDGSYERRKRKRGEMKITRIILYLL